MQLCAHFIFHDALFPLACMALNNIATVPTCHCRHHSWTVTSATAVAIAVTTTVAVAAWTWIERECALTELATGRKKGLQHFVST